MEKSNRILWDIEAFRQGKITEEELRRLKDGLAEVRREISIQEFEKKSFGHLRTV